jgi:transposase
MYPYAKIKDAIFLYKNKKNLKMNIDVILFTTQIARSTLYDWIEKFSYLLDSKMSYILSKRTSKKIRSNRKLTAEIEIFIVNHVRNNPDFNIKKLTNKVIKKFGVKFSVSHIYRILGYNNLTYKKVQKITYPYGKVRFKKAVKNIKKDIDKCNNDFTAIDETAVYLGSANNYGWSKKGDRCKINSSFNKSNKYSLCQAISKKSFIASEMIKGSYNTKKFNMFIEDKVIPNMDNNVLFMDGCTIHKSKELSEKLKENNIIQLINVPYSPQFNPIEYTFNTLKFRIKKENVTTKKQLENVIKKHVNDGNKNSFQNYYEHTYKNLEMSINSK